MSVATDTPLIGQLAVDEGLITEQQLGQCLMLQSQAELRLGDLFQVQGLLDPAQVGALRGRMMAQIDQSDEAFRTGFHQEFLLGRLIINWELASPEQLREAVTEKLVREAEGLAEPLGEIMVRFGFLTPYQLQRLHAQKRVQLVCPACEVHYSVLGYEEGFRLKCSKCKGPLEESREQSEEAAQTRQIFFDKGQMEDLSLFGRVALKGNYITKADLGKAVSIQASHRRGARIGEVLREIGAITPGELKEIEKALKQVRKQLAKKSRKQFQGSTLGQIAVERGYLTEENLQLMLREQARLSEEGSHQRLGELLVEAEFLTTFQLMNLLSLQDKTILSCPKCSKKVNALHLPDDALMKCPDCKVEMEEAGAADSVGVSSTLAVNLADLAAVAPVEPSGAKNRAVGYHKQLLALRDKAVADLNNPLDTSSILTSPLDQTTSLFNFAMGESQPNLRKRIDLEALSDWVARCHGRQPLWKVTALGRHWFCPFCGVAAVRYKQADQLPEKICDHLARRCQVFSDVGMVPVFPLKELNRRAVYMALREKIAADQAWQIRDRGNRWVCPFCVGVTPIEIAGGRVSKQAFDEIVEHLSICSPFQQHQDPSRHRPVKEILLATVKASFRQKLTERIRQLVKKHPVWQVTSDGQWACPYCRELQSEVKADTPLNLQLNCPPTITKHLLGGCQAYRKKQPPAASPEQLLALTRGEQVDESAPVVGEAPDLGLDQSQEMQTLQSQIEGQMAAMQKELNKARGQQQAMLPEVPELAGLDIKVHYQPCDQLGGDFYDFIPLGERRLGIVLGDVSGHGVTAALVMGMCKKALNLVSRTTDSPARALVLANEEIRHDLDGRTFVTLWYGILDLAAGTLRFARAGQEPMLVFNASSSTGPQAYQTRGMAAGIASGSGFQNTLEEAEIKLTAGDLICLYTDGLTESKNDDGMVFGSRRLEAALADYGEEACDHVIEKLLGSIRSFSGSESFEDDLTILMMRYGV